jgi:hypothetical protein
MLLSPVLESDRVVSEMLLKRRRMRREVEISLVATFRVGVGVGGPYVSTSKNHLINHQLNLPTEVQSVATPKLAWQ